MAYNKWIIMAGTAKIEYGDSSKVDENSIVFSSFHIFINKKRITCD